jgi:hypothetical protein
LHRFTRHADFLADHPLTVDTSFLTPATIDNYVRFLNRIRNDRNKGSCKGWCNRKPFEDYIEWKTGVAALVATVSSNNQHGRLRAITKLHGIKNLVILDSCIIVCCNRMVAFLHSIRANLRDMPGYQPPATRVRLENMPNQAIIDNIRHQAH